VPELEIKYIRLINIIYIYYIFLTYDPTLVTKYSKGIYAEGRVAQCTKCLTYVLRERGLVTLKGIVHSLVHPFHSLSQFMPRFQSVQVVLSLCKQMYIDVNSTIYSTIIIKNTS
jgi:hypothetical protein